jgi:hypothetical protein
MKNVEKFSQGLPRKFNAKKQPLINLKTKYQVLEFNYHISTDVINLPYYVSVNPDKME